MIHDGQRLLVEPRGERESAVAEQVDLRVVLILHQRLGEAQGFVESRDGIRRARCRKRAPEGRLFAGGGLLDLGDRARLEHDHLILVAQAVHVGQRFRAGGFETAGLHVGRLHGGRRIKYQHAQPACRGIAGEVRPGQCQDHEEQQQQLEQQQPVIAELLKGRVGLILREKLLPEQRAGTRRRAAT